MVSPRTITSCQNIIDYTHIYTNVATNLHLRKKEYNIIPYCFIPYIVLSTLINDIYTILIITISQLLSP